LVPDDSVLPGQGQEVRTLCCEAGWTETSTITKVSRQIGKPRALLAHSARLPL
jgi:hypothetical protein